MRYTNTDTDIDITVLLRSQDAVCSQYRATCSDTLFSCFTSPLVRRHTA